ncbi:hypothetical protein PGTUg99_006806 [Puccinia graminis f. sp. tritici]|uniref:Uncharacterized protein n=1 Tax=Puccinia graminis f. sp. tritici TaxID=56615 RepID=A0A5B0RTG7_PUCGR|nr:hypothetical protein PGTUg99_006806 [Puccinia graminis f. sp. tritici]
MHDQLSLPSDPLLNEPAPLALTSSPSLTLAHMLLGSQTAPIPPPSSMLADVLMGSEKCGMENDHQYAHGYVPPVALLAEPVGLHIITNMLKETFNPSHPMPKILQLLDMLKIIQLMDTVNIL